MRCERPSYVEDQPCQACVEAQVQCTSDSPRRIRVYGSVESLSLRFRVLEALVKGVFPGKDTDDIDVLYEIAAEHHITLPKLTDDTHTHTPIMDVFSKIPEGVAAASPAHSDGSQQTMKDEPTPTVKSTTLPSSPQERLVPTSRGQTSHFIGPSSSFGFVLTTRSFAGEYAAILRVVEPNHPSLKLMIDFAESKWSKGLEPNVTEEKHTAPGPADLKPDTRVPRSTHVIPVMTGKDFSPEAPLSLLLPTREIADILVRSFFHRVHPNFMIFRRCAFEQSYNLVWNQLNVQVQDFELGLLCCVLMVLVLGAQSLEPHDGLYLEMIRRYYDWVMHKASELQCSSALANVQALLLLQLYQHSISERNTAFMMLGAASRMATNLGMHREGAIKNLDSYEQELRRRIWWTIYVLEHNSCTILGRPCAIDDREVSVHFPNEDLLDGSECVPMGYVENLVQLTKIMADISRRMYPLSSIPNEDSERQRIHNAKVLLSELESWHHRLPKHLRLDFQTSSANHMRAICLLHLQFHLTQSLVARPFILRKVAVQVARKVGKHVRSQELDDEELKLSYKCGLFSKQAIILAHQLITSGQFNGVTWMDPYYVYHSVIVVSLDYLAKDEKDTDEDISRKKVVSDMKNAMDNIRLCPLYAMLTQVGFQLAEIVGIVDNHASRAQFQQIDARHLQPNVQGIPDLDFSPENPQQSSMGNVLDFYLQSSQINLPWKVASDSFTHPPQVSAPMIGSFLNRGVSVMDEQAVATAMPTMPGQMQPQQPYMNWATGYEVIPSQTQYGNSQAGPPPVNGNAHSHAHFGGSQPGSSRIGNGHGHARSQYENTPPVGPSHGNGDRIGHAHAHFRAYQSGPSPNGNGNYDMQRNT